MAEFLFQDWATLARTIVVGILSYAALIAILRASGKRTLAKMNAFDFIVTIALGSTLASILLSPDVALAEGLVALGLLVGLQFATALASSRFGAFKRIVTSEPTLLVMRGEVLRGALRRERIAELEIHQAARQQGFSSLAEVEAMVLESDGTFSVLGEGTAHRSTLASVPDYRATSDGGDSDAGGGKQQQRSKGSDRSVEG
ncbi:MAG: DUF421 domain-containing protein [Chloroflexi bacterium]|nr:DUF421 domain-containing protein [Chloroflexota bacterium]